MEHIGVTGLEKMEGRENMSGEKEQKQEACNDGKTTHPLKPRLQTSFFPKSERVPTCYNNEHCTTYCSAAAPLLALKKKKKTRFALRLFNAYNYTEMSN